MDTIHSKLVAIQSGLKAPKDQTNKHFGYKYRSCEGIVEAVKPLAHAQGCSVTLSDEVVEVEGKTYVKATASLLDATSSVHATGFAAEPTPSPRMDAPQCTGSASTYARKRALDGLFAIDDTSDSDATMGTPEPKAKSVAPTAPVKPTIEQVIKAISEAKTESMVEKLHGNAIKYVWTADEKKMIEETKNHRLDVLLLA